MKLCVMCILMGIQFERPRLNGQRSTLTFGIYGHFLIKLTYSYNDIGLKKIKKSTFQKFVH